MVGRPPKRKQTRGKLRHRTADKHAMEAGFDFALSMAQVNNTSRSSYALLAF